MARLDRAIGINEMASIDGPVDPPIKSGKGHDE
jgi:hypothetical protein